MPAGKARLSKNRLRSLLAVAAAGGLLAGCATAEQDTSMDTAAATGQPVGTADLPEELTGQKLDWAECGATDEAPAPGKPWQCASLTVPEDYSDPDGATMEIALIRTEATGDDADQRIGSLLFNFGGPGGSGVSTLPAFADEAYRTLGERYDLVSFDPRGVGESEGVVCLDDAELDRYFAESTIPGDDAGEREYVKQLKEFAAACDDRAGDLLPHLTTTNTARDMDLMRQVLGDDQLYYFGTSYGTELGAVYAHLFPEEVGRAALDAVVDPTAEPADGALAQAEGFQLAVENYMDDCFSDDDCPLGGSQEEGERTLAELLDDLESEPLPTRDPDDRPLTAPLAWGGIAQSLYSEQLWPVLTEGLADALDENDPDGTTLLMLGDQLNGRSSDGTYSTLQASLRAISCADSSARYTVEDVRERLPEFKEASPVFGEMMAWSMLECDGWPAEGESEHPEVSAEGSAPVLLIGTTGDPATPYAGMANMAEALGDDVAVQVTYEGEGHGAYFSGDPCVTEAVDGYLLDGTVPESGLTCG